jgi:hypothetical protein
MSHTRDKKDTTLDDILKLVFLENVFYVLNLWTKFKSYVVLGEKTILF